MPNNQDNMTMRIKTLLDLSVPFMKLVDFDTASSNTERYPEWKSRRKIRGKRDHSLRIRANRRKNRR